MDLHNGSTTTIPNSSSDHTHGSVSDSLFDHREEPDSNCSTPYVSAPSSPGRSTHPGCGYFFSAPTSPMHYMLSSSNTSPTCTTSLDHSGGSFEFDFSARFSSSSNSASAAGSMISADELFLNGQIRPMKLSTHLQRPQLLAPLLDLEAEEEQDSSNSLRGRDLRLRNRSLHRRARSLSPLRNSPWHRQGNDDNEDDDDNDDTDDNDAEKTVLPESSTETTPSVSAASSRSSSSGSRSSKRWDFLKDFLRSKSEGRGNSKDKFWNSLSFSPIKDKKATKLHHQPPLTPPSSAKSKSIQSNSGRSKPANGVSKRRVPPSAHELHYTAKRAQAEEMKKKTFLPYRQGLLGCLGFSSKGYGAMNGFAKSLNPVSSR